MVFNFICQKSILLCRRQNICKCFARKGGVVARIWYFSEGVDMKVQTHVKAGANANPGRLPPWFGAIRNWGIR